MDMGGYGWVWVGMGGYTWIWVVCGQKTAILAGPGAVNVAGVSKTLCFFI